MPNETKMERESDTLSYVVSVGQLHRYLPLMDPTPAQISWKVEADEKTLKYWLAISPLRGILDHSR